MTLSRHCFHRRELLKPSASIALHRHSNALVDVLPPEADSSISLLSQSERPDVTYQARAPCPLRALPTQLRRFTYAAGAKRQHTVAPACENCQRHLPACMWTPASTLPSILPCDLPEGHS